MGWRTAELQHGYSVRLRLLEDGPAKMASQFREPGRDWEPIVISQRQDARSSYGLLVLSTSFALSCVGSATLFGWQIGVDMMTLVLVHELGHALAMRWLGVLCGPIVFIPFVGAGVEMRGTPVHATHNAIIALAGPYIGTAAALACLAVGAGGVSPSVSLTLANFGFLLNLMNLLPIGVLDGGRLVPLLSPWALPVGLCLFAVCTVAMPNCWVLYALLASTAYALGRPRLPMCAAATGLRQSSPPLAPHWTGLGSRQRTAISVAYLGLAGLLIGAIGANDSLRMPASHAAPATYSEC